MKEMFEVFNMGHRLEIYSDKEIAQTLIDIAASYNVEAQIIGRCEPYSQKKLTIAGISY
jgi:phosphoribosylformylglycinamidine cyclo-ligase